MDACVESLVMPREEDQLLLFRQFLRLRLRERLAARAQEHDAPPPQSTVRHDRAHGAKHRLRLQDHAAAAAEGRIINLLVLIKGKVPQLRQTYVEQPLLPRALDDALTEHRFKHRGKERHDVNPHGLPTLPASRHAKILRRCRSRARPSSVPARAIPRRRASSPHRRHCCPS